MSLAVAVGVATYGALAGSRRYGAVHGSPAEISAVKSSFLRANVLIENLGARPPRGASEPGWLLVSHHGVPSRSVDPEGGAWTDGSGRLVTLTPLEGRGLAASQSRVVGQLFVGSAKSQILAELGQIVRSELGAHPTISAPGGASIRKWLRLDVSGSVAHVEADVNVWEETLSAQHPGAHVSFSASAVANQVDAFATLTRIQGHWRIRSFNQVPWQEAT